MNSNNLGEIFYNGRIINLKSANNDELEDIIRELEQEQNHKKETIKNILNRIVIGGV